MEIKTKIMMLFHGLSAFVNLNSYTLSQIVWLWAALLSPAKARCFMVSHGLIFIDWPASTVEEQDNYIVQFKPIFS